MMPVSPLRRGTATSEHAERLVATLGACATDVFETMVGRPLTQVHPARGDAPRPTGNIVGTIGFTGSSAGLVAFYTTYEAAREITSGLLGFGEPGTATRDEVVDAIGEVTNMIAGSFRTRLASHGDPWAIATPTVTLGSDFCITPVRSVQRTVLPFRMDRYEVSVELILMRRVTPP